MYLIIDNENILKVSISKENEEQIEVLNCPEDLILKPMKYLYVGSEIVINEAYQEEPIEPEILE